jgi:hypothetical protein
MKNLGYKVSVNKGTNKVYGTTEADWSPIRQGSLIKIGRDNVYYEVAASEKSMFIQPYSVHKGIVHVNVDTGAKIFRGDILTFSFKERHISKIARIKNAGSGYKEGDSLCLKGGCPSLNVQDGTVKKAILIVSKVNEAGEILGIRVEYSGKYISTPSDVCQLEGGIGKNGVVEVIYELNQERATVEREVVSAKVGVPTRLVLNQPLPEGVREGKVSSSKWVVSIIGDYVGDNQHAVDYEVARDFTPHLKLPRYVVGSSNPEVFYNKAMTILDNRIKEIEKRMEK